MIAVQNNYVSIHEFMKNSKSNCIDFCIDELLIEFIWIKSDFDVPTQVSISESNWKPAGQASCDSLREHENDPMVFVHVMSGGQTSGSSCKHSLTSNWLWTSWFVNKLLKTKNRVVFYRRKLAILR